MALFVLTSGIAAMLNFSVRFSVDRFGVLFVWLWLKWKLVLIVIRVMFRFLVRILCVKVLGARLVSMGLKGSLHRRLTFSWVSWPVCDIVPTRWKGAGALFWWVVKHLCGRGLKAMIFSGWLG